MSTGSRQAEACPLLAACCCAITIKAWGSGGANHEAPRRSTAEPAAQALHLLQVRAEWKEKRAGGRQRAPPLLRRAQSDRLHPHQLQQSFKTSYNTFSPARL